MKRDIVLTGLARRVTIPQQADALAGETRQ